MLLQEAPAAVVVPLEMGCFPAGARGAASALPAPGSSLGGESCAVAQCPPQADPTGASHGAGGLASWVPHVGEQYVCRHLPWLSHSSVPAPLCGAGVQPPPSGCAAQHMQGAVCCCQGSYFHSSQSLVCYFSYPLWFLKFTDLLLVSE